MLINAENAVAQLFPALGYFGSAPSDALRIELSGSIRGIEISLTDEEPQILNLMGLKLVKADAVVKMDEANCVFEQSSIYQNDARFAPVSLIAERGIHTNRERNPFWRVVFRSALEVDFVRIANRGDEWGKRSRTLLVSVLYEASDTWTQVYNAQSATVMLSTLLAGIHAANDTTIGGSQSMETVRDEIVSRAAQRVMRGELVLESVDWQKFMNFLPIWNGDFSDSELTVTAAKIFHEKAQYEKAALTDTAFMFRKPAEILALQKRINEVARCYGETSVLIISRHGLQRSKLQTHAEQYMSHLLMVIDVAGDLGFEPVLAYGTLLGAIRDHIFIPHDDDVDVLCKVDAVDFETAEVAMQPLLKEFERRGFKIVRFPGTLNAHIVDKVKDVSVDIFPCWNIEDEVFLHMERMKIRQVPKDYLYPSKKIAFYGVDVPVPGNPELFLKARYGEGWGVSNQFFEWPWPISE